MLNGVPPIRMCRLVFRAVTAHGLDACSGGVMPLAMYFMPAMIRCPNLQIRADYSRNTHLHRARVRNFERNTSTQRKTHLLFKRHHVKTHPVYVYTG